MEVNKTDKERTSHLNSNKDNYVVSEHFRRLSGKRISFIGEIDEVQELPHKVNNIKKNKGKIITFVNVYETNTKELFRDHVHILIKNSDYDKYFKGLTPDDLINHSYRFEAEIYNYVHKPKIQFNHKLNHKILYQELGVGLRNITGVKSI